MRRFVYVFALSLALLLWATIPIHAQTTNGSIEGAVTDQSGGAISGASVTARNMDTGLTQTTTTTQAGIYSLQNIPPGRYSVTVEAPNLKKYTREGVTVSTGTAVSLDIPMQVGAVSESITVSADASQLQTTTSEIGATVESKLVANLPLQVSGTIRNPVQFIELVPGFVGSVANDPGSNSSDDFKVNGGQEGGTDILVDGVSISLVSPNTQWNKGVSTDAVDEFRVLQSNFSAEYGQSGDGIVSLTVKSGTNEVHGSVYDFLRNAGLDANSWVNNLTDQKRSVDTQNDFGATFGGPVWIPKVYNGKNKTFFFFAYEGFRLRNGGTGIDSFPNEDFRGGNFAALCTEGFTNGICNNLANQLYDPTTHAAIPGDLLTNDPNFTPSKVMTNIFGLLPPTNGSLNNNVIDRSVSSTSANLFDVKIDHIFSDKHRISGGFDYDNTDTGGSSDLGPIFGSRTPQSTRYARITDNYVFSPTIVNQAMFGFSRRFRGEVSNSLGQGYPEQIGLTGVNNTTFPCIKWGDTNYQVNNCGDSQFADNVYQITDAVSWVKGKHSFKFGGEIRMLQFNVRRLTQGSGEFDFAAAQTSSTGDASGVGGNSVASGLFGLSDTTTLNYGNFSGVRYKDFAMYAQDSYRFSSKLTLNYGLRYDIDLPASEAFNRFSAVDPNLPNPDAGNILGAYTYYGYGTGRNGQKRPQDIYYKAFGPRVGFAYSINDKTVVRGGYGIYYEALKEGSFADQDGLGFFNRQTVNVTNGGPTQIDNGVTHIFPPTGPLTPGGQNNQNGVILVPPNSGRPADIQTWNLDVQRQVMNNMMLSVAYVGSKGTHLPALNIIPNQVNPSFLTLGSELTMPASCLAADTCPNSVAAGLSLPYAGFTGNINQLLRPFPQYGNFNQEDNSFTPDRTGNSTYNAMQLQLNKRFSQGLSFLVSYTVSKNITDADSAGPGVSGFIGTNSFIGENSYNRKAEKAVSQLDTPQSLVMSFFYELPVGQGKQFLNGGGAKDRIVSGWYVSTILTYHSGTPTEVYGNCQGTAGDVLFGGCNVTGAGARVNIVPGVPQTNKSNFNPTTEPFWNPAAFTPATNCATSATTCTFGNEPRSLSTARSFAGKNEDFTIGKKTHLIGDKALIDFQASFFNMFNRHIYSTPSNVFGPSLQTPFIAAGQPGCSGPLACGFGAVTGSSGPRIIQFGLKISY
ncbi:MAG TPA: TonB-dependent receptor [Candidatus Acidoferrum sp.]|nr:TonB-dependent receptor [Candidatus Acidoferrum sp.]